MGIATAVRHGRKRPSWCTSLICSISGWNVSRVLRTEPVWEPYEEHVDVEDKDFVISWHRALWTGRYDRTVFESFGLVIIDEAHHWAAPTLSKTMDISARCLLALTATLTAKTASGTYFRTGGTVALVTQGSNRRHCAGNTIDIWSCKGSSSSQRQNVSSVTISMMIKDEA